MFSRAFDLRVSPTIWEPGTGYPSRLSDGFITRPSPRTFTWRARDEALRASAWEAKDAFQRSELAGRTMAGPVILRENRLLLREFAEKPSPPAYYLGLDWSDWIVLIKSEIPNTTGMIWPGLLEAWLVLTSVKYHGNLYILIPLNQRLALTRLRTTGPWPLSSDKWKAT